MQLYTDGKTIYCYSPTVEKIAEPIFFETSGKHRRLVERFGELLFRRKCGEIWLYNGHYFLIHDMILTPNELITYKELIYKDKHERR